MISRKMTNKKVQAIILSAILSTVCATTAFAAEDTTKIISIPLEIVSNIDEKENVTDVDITTSSKLFDVVDYEITNEPDEIWQEGEKPKLKIKLEVSDKEEFFFDTDLSEEAVTLTLTSPNTESKEAKITKVIRSGKNKAYVYVTLPAVGDGKYDLDIPEISWGADNKAYWDEAEDATSYELKLYRDGKLVNSKTITTTDRVFDFSEYFTEEGEYEYKIRAVYNKSHKGDWEDSDELEITQKEAVKQEAGKPAGTVVDNKQGTWVKDKVGWWWLNADRTWPKNEWKEINNKYYFFNNSGYIHTGWVFTDGNWYFCNDNGERVVNTTISDCKLNTQGIWVGTPNTWFKWGDDWYYFGKDGKPVLNQWVQTSEAWFYCGQDGRILKNTTTPDGYQVDGNGAWIE